MLYKICLMWLYISIVNAVRGDKSSLSNLSRTRDRGDSNISSNANDRTSSALPIVYVYTVVASVCRHGLPEYIIHTLRQAVFSQADSSDVILASNFGECVYIE